MCMMAAVVSMMTNMIKTVFLFTICFLLYYVDCASKQSVHVFFCLDANTREFPRPSLDMTTTSTQAQSITFRQMSHTSGESYYQVTPVNTPHVLTAIRVYVFERAHDALVINCWTTFRNLHRNMEYMSVKWRNNQLASFSIATIC